MLTHLVACVPLDYIMLLRVYIQYSDTALLGCSYYPGNDKQRDVTRITEAACIHFPFEFPLHIPHYCAWAMEDHGCPLGLCTTHSICPMAFFDVSPNWDTN